MHITCKLYHIGEYSTLIEKSHERIKRKFLDLPVCSIETCFAKRESCSARVDYTLDGVFYKVCTYERFFSFSNFDESDFELLKHIFTVEAPKNKQ